MKGKSEKKRAAHSRLIAIATLATQVAAVPDATASTGLDAYTPQLEGRRDRSSTTTLNPIGLPDATAPATPPEPVYVPPPPPPIDQDFDQDTDTDTDFDDFDRDDMSLDDAGSPPDSTPDTQPGTDFDFDADADDDGGE